MPRGERRLRVRARGEQGSPARRSGGDGHPTPRTIAVVGHDRLRAAAARIEPPFITKHNQGGKGLGVRLFRDRSSFERWLDDEPQVERPVDGVMLLQQYVEPPRVPSPAWRSSAADDPLVAAHVEFCARHGMDVAGIEFVTDRGGRRWTYDVNMNTNYNSEIEATLGIDGMGAIADSCDSLSRDGR